MEEPLPAGGSCLLGSLNLSEFVINPFKNDAHIDYDALEQAVNIAVVGLNQVLIEGLNLHPLEEQRDTVKNWRQIGLGTMGLADMLIKLGYTYGSERSLKVIDEVYKTIAKMAVLTSNELAISHGCYPMCEKEKLIDSAFIKNLNLDQATLDNIKKYGLYNSQLLTCAPTGTIGTMLQISTGVEPVFAMKYTRRTVSLNNEETFYDVYTKIADDYIKANHTTELPKYFVESKDIKPLDRIKVQAVLQKYTDASISSTINLPNSATIDDVYNIYLEAWKNGLKGVTVYRAGCKREGILTTSEKKPVNTSTDSSEDKQCINQLFRGTIVKAGDNCIGLKRTLTTGCGTLHCTAYFDPETGDLRETYLSKGSQGGCNNFMIGLSRMISLSARGGIKLNDIVDQLKSCGTCPSYAVRRATKHDTSLGSCCPVAVGNALVSMHNEILERIKCCPQNDIIKEDLPKESKDTSVEIVKPIEINDEKYSECPECHSKSLVHDGGCTQCLACGYSKCS